MSWNFNLTGQGMPERLRGAFVSGELFPTLGRAAHAGRALDPRDAAGTVVISYPLWQRVFGSDPSIVGRRITLDGDAVTVAGVMPRDFAFPSDEIDVWSPLVWGVHFQSEDREGRNLRMVARLRDGVTLAKANAIARTVLSRIGAVSPATHEGWSARAVTVQESQTSELRPTLLLIFAAAAAMLGIAGANTMNVLMMLGASRRRELATRVALGAGPLRLIRQSLAEGIVLGGAAGAVALALAAAALRLVARLHLPLPDVALDLRVAAAGLGAALVAGIAATVIPTLIFSRLALAGPLRQSHQVLAPGGRLRGAFVIAQIALTSALLISAGVLVKSFERLMSVDPGFDTRGILTARLWLPSAYDTSAKQTAFFEQAAERLARLPGVAAVGTIQDLPLRGNAMTFDVTVDENRATNAAYRVVSDGYFAAIGIPLLRGRAFTRTDDATAPRVFVINRALAVRAFAGLDPIGRRMRIDDGSWGTVVGIAGDVRHMGLDAEEVPAVYQPLRQKTFDWLRWTTIVLRTGDATAASLALPLRREIMVIDPNQPVFEIAALGDVLRERVARPRAAAWVVSTLGTVAFLVALIGIAGVLSYAVTLRLRELGIRLALGARSAELVRLVVRQGMMLAVPGVLAGLAIAVSISPLLDRLLYRVAALDVSVYALVSVAFLGAAGLASLIPARRAAAIDPAITLRAE
jgi:predicted permease